MSEYVVEINDVVESMYTFASGKTEPFTFRIVDMEDGMEREVYDIDFRSPIGQAVFHRGIDELVVIPLNEQWQNQIKIVNVIKSRQR